MEEINSSGITGIIKGIDIVTKGVLKNQDNIIERDPKAIVVKIRHNDTSGLFGYQQVSPTSEVISKAIIIFSAEKSLLRKAGFFLEKDLPILAFFKHSDNVKPGDTIIAIMKDYSSDLRELNEYEKVFQVLEIRGFGGYFNAKKVWVLAPVR